MNFIQKAINHVHRVFPDVYETRSVRGSYHWAFAYKRNALVAVGLNRPEQMDARALKFARKLNLREKMNYPFIHAEESLISRLISLDKLDNSLNIVVLRLNVRGELQMSKPCTNCEQILQAYGLSRIYYSTSTGEVVRLQCQQYM